MKHFYENLGEKWFTYPELYSAVVEKFPSGSHFVEVGTWKGMSAAYMAVEIINSGKDIRFDCVDTWDFVPSQAEIPPHLFNGLYEVFIKNIEPVRHQVNPVQAISWDGAALYKDNSLDFVFIDAAHDYESVRKDIHAWFPKVKKEGVIAGHDYECADVRKAVTEFFQGYSIHESEGCWIAFPKLPEVRRHWTQTQG
jgi:predicted O-methyltransferase YrrM